MYGEYQACMGSTKPESRVHESANPSIELRQALRRPSRSDMAPKMGAPTPTPAKKSEPRNCTVDRDRRRRRRRKAGKKKKKKKKKMVIIKLGWRTIDSEREVNRS